MLACHFQISCMTIVSFVNATAGYQAEPSLEESQLMESAHVRESPVVSTECDSSCTPLSDCNERPSNELNQFQVCAVAACVIKHNTMFFVPLDSDLQAIHNELQVMIRITLMWILNRPIARTEHPSSVRGIRSYHDHQVNVVRPSEEVRVFCCRFFGTLLAQVFCFTSCSFLCFRSPHSIAQLVGLSST